ncbi:SH3 domain-containing YSC84-like protein 1 [Branchiostoma floridae]|uniref:SH3 domain-containing YSC84-like protein 1 n=1 Tax=Branchiostoma floridae TaxID=7739 RepID=A0A9J7HXV4_BRAFL|nr:SH3 domain-containing YSC84-like protein 1 [Branchiostoma floridae]
MVNTPVPHSLKSEAKKAAKILRDFTVPSAKTGPDKIIPVSILARARGLAVLTVFKAGFLVSARGGSGIVIARISESRWSAPSAVGLAGLGGGFEIGAEVTDFVIILNTQSAVDAFSKGGNLTLGGNFTIAAGPLGRNMEGDVAVRSPSAIYTYSKTKGLFAGISLEGTGIIERKDANRKFYGGDVRAYEILNGTVHPPSLADPLYEILHRHYEAAEKILVEAAKKAAVKKATKADRPKSFSFGSSRSKSLKNSSTSDVKPSRKTRSKFTSARRCTSLVEERTASEEDLQSIIMDRLACPFEVTALFSFAGELPCDLYFQEGDKITVLTRTHTQNDWWEGRLKGRKGIFPANYVQLPRP